MTELTERLKLNLRESTAPFFSDAELKALLEDARYDLELASYNGLLRKAEDDSMTLPSGLCMPNNRRYWLTLARGFRRSAGGSVKRGRSRGV